MQTQSPGWRPYLKESWSTACDSVITLSVTSYHSTLHTSLLIIVNGEYPPECLTHLFLHVSLHFAQILAAKQNPELVIVCRTLSGHERGRHGGRTVKPQPPTSALPLLSLKAHLRDCSRSLVTAGQLSLRTLSMPLASSVGVDCFGDSYIRPTYRFLVCKKKKYVVIFVLIQKD